jgi:hypothetical protein
VIPCLCGVAQAAEAISCFLFGNLHPIHSDAFAEIDKVWRCVETRSMACRTQARIQHGADRALAIGSGDMKKTQALMRIPDGSEQTMCIVEAELDSSELGIVQPIQRFLEIHFVPR